MKSFFRFALLSLILVVVALVSALTAMRLAIHVHEVDVPNVVGKTPAEARRDAEENGLRLEIERQYYSTDVAEGKILSQAPLAGSKVRRGWTVRVAQSLGPQRVTIPNVIGQSERAAEINIRQRGLEVGAVARLQMPGTVPDEVLSQSPPPNATDVAVPRISLLVAAPAQPQAFVMPDFTGEPLGTARLELQDAGLREGNVSVSPQFADRSSSGEFSAASLIVTQSPAAGEKVTAGTAVNFEVR
jgi:eukaryotic-like serine/threonine-protein kinase